MYGTNGNTIDLHLIAQRIGVISRDIYLNTPTATINENPPLALMQLAAKSEINALLWVLGADFRVNGMLSVETAKKIDCIVVKYS